MELSENDLYKIEEKCLDRINLIHSEIMNSMPDDLKSDTIFEDLILKALNLGMRICIEEINLKSELKDFYNYDNSYVN